MVLFLMLTTEKWCQQAIFSHNDLDNALEIMLSSFFHVSVKHLVATKWTNASLRTLIWALIKKSQKFFFENAIDNMLILLSLFV